MYAATFSFLPCLRRVALAHSSLSWVLVRKFPFIFFSKSSHVRMLSRSSRNQSRALPSSKCNTCDSMARFDMFWWMRSVFTIRKNLKMSVSCRLVGGLSPLNRTFQLPICIGFRLSMSGRRSPSRTLDRAFVVGRYEWQLWCRRAPSSFSSSRPCSLCESEMVICEPSLFDLSRR